MQDTDCPYCDGGDYETLSSAQQWNVTPHGVTAQRNLRVRCRHCGCERSVVMVGGMHAEAICDV